jgi:hypothetical protein
MALKLGLGPVLEHKLEHKLIVKCSICGGDACNGGPPFKKRLSRVPIALYIRVTTEIMQICPLCGCDVLCKEYVAERAAKFYAERGITTFGHEQ